MPPFDRTSLNFDEFATSESFVIATSSFATPGGPDDGGIENSGTAGVDEFGPSWIG